MARVASSVVGVEVVSSAVDLANRNALANNISNYRAVCSTAENLSEDSMQDVDVVVVDPPRSGLHRKVIDMLLKSLPNKIIYLSCNPETQARDLKLLNEQYSIDSVSGYDFYPGTLHLESLVILERI